MKLLIKLERSKDFWFLLLVSLFFFFLRFPSLFEPYWYGDEGIYQAMALAINKGHVLYTQIYDNKPPFLYLFYALFNGDQFTLRFLSLVSGIIATILLYILSKKLFQQSRKAAVTTALVFTGIFATPLLEGNIANAENFMLPLIIAAGLLVYTAANTQRYSLRALTHTKTIPSIVRNPLFYAGLLLSSAFLFKIVALFDTTAFALFLFFLIFPEQFSVRKQKQTYLVFARSFIPFFLGFFIPIFLTAGVFSVQGAFFEFFKASFMQNVGYVGYSNTFFIPQGFLFLKIGILFTTTGLLFLYRKTIPAPLLFLYLWIVWGLFNTFFSGRPYLHYVLVLIPSFALLCGAAVEDRLHRAKHIVALMAVLTIVLFHFSFYAKVIPYYTMFFGYLKGTVSPESYQGFFDGNTPTDYKIAQFVKTHLTPEDTIYIWGNNAQLYKLIEKAPMTKYVVAYHIRGNQQALQKTEETLSKTKPRFIILMDNAGQYPFGLTGYQQVYQIGKGTLYERLF